MNSLKSSSHGYGQLVYHFEWCPKYRYRVFGKPENRKLCEQVLWEVAERYGITIRELAVMPDHIHVAVDIPPDMSVSRAFQLLKGASSYELFRRQPKFRLRYPHGHFWSRGKFYRSVGDVDLERTTNYIKEQRESYQTNLGNFSHLGSHTL